MLNIGFEETDGTNKVSVFFYLRCMYVRKLRDLDSSLPLLFRLHPGSVTRRRKMEKEEEGGGGEGNGIIERRRRRKQSS